MAKIQAPRAQDRLWSDDELPRQRKSDLLRLRKLIDGDDGLIAEQVKPHTKEKLDCVVAYTKLSSGPRRRYIGAGNAGATLIDLFCGTGRIRIGRSQWIDGSPVAAWNASVESGAPFSKIIIADVDDQRRSACAMRLKRLGAPVVEILGSAVMAVHEVPKIVNPYGLHLALLDPYNLGMLNFEIIEVLATLKRPDLLMHVSAMDLQRNIRANLALPTWDRVAPGWRETIDPTKSEKEMSGQFISYWRDLVAELGVWPSVDMRLITGPKSIRLYWLLLAGKHELAHKFWKIASNLRGQRDLGLFGGYAIR